MSWSWIDLILQLNTWHFCPEGGKTGELPYFGLHDLSVLSQTVAEIRFVLWFLYDVHKNVNDKSLE
jgi:hypothetical protein